MIRRPILINPALMAPAYQKQRIPGNLVPIPYN